MKLTFIRNAFLIFWCTMAVIFFACAISLCGFSVGKSIRDGLNPYVTIVAIGDNDAYCMDPKTHDPTMTYFSDGGGVCGYVAPIGVVVNEKLLRKLEREQMDEYLAKHK